MAHEISHSWTGNLVTNANWEHFWLNEGFTMFLEGKICGRMFGDAARDFHALQGITELKDNVCTLKLVRNTISKIEWLNIIVLFHFESFSWPLNCRKRPS